MGEGEETGLAEPGPQTLHGAGGVEEFKEHHARISGDGDTGGVFGECEALAIILDASARSLEPIGQRSGARFSPGTSQFLRNVMPNL